MAISYTLTEEAVKKLRADHERLRQDLRNLRATIGSLPRIGLGRQRVEVGKADSSIAALSGSTPGSGTVSIWEWNGTTWADSTRNETAYNFSGAAVTSGLFLHLIRHSQSGRLLVTFESCT